MHTRVGAGVAIVGAVAGVITILMFLFVDRTQLCRAVGICDPEIVVEIVSPRDGEDVGWVVDVDARVTGLPDGHTVWLVETVRESGRHYINESYDNGDNTWSFRAEVFLPEWDTPGEARQALDVYVADEHANDQFQDFIDRAKDDPTLWAKGYGNVLPQGLVASDRVMVHLALNPSG